MLTATLHEAYKPGIENFSVISAINTAHTKCAASTCVILGHGSGAGEASDTLVSDGRKIRYFGIGFGGQAGSEFRANGVTYYRFRHSVG